MIHHIYSQCAHAPQFHLHAYIRQNESINQSILISLTCSSCHSLYSWWYINESLHKCQKHSVSSNDTFNVCGSHTKKFAKMLKTVILVAFFLCFASSTFLLNSEIPISFQLNGVEVEQTFFNGFDVPPTPNDTENVQYLIGKRLPGECLQSTYT